MTTKMSYQIHMRKNLTLMKMTGEVFTVLPFMCCRDVKMQIFQYKINMRCLMTNNRLYRMNIVNDNLCPCVNMMWKQWNICFLNVTK